MVGSVSGEMGEAGDSDGPGGLRESVFLGETSEADMVNAIGL